MKKFQALMKSRFENAKKDNKGFSLVELIIAVVILGIIAVVAIGGLYGNVTKSRVNTDVSNARDIQSALSTLSADKDIYKWAQSATADLTITWSDATTTITVTGTDGVAYNDGTDHTSGGFAYKVSEILSEGLPASKTNGTFKITLSAKSGNPSVTCKIYKDSACSSELTAEE